MVNIICIIPSICSEKSYPILKRCITCIKQSKNIAKNIQIKILVITNGEKIVLKELRNSIDYLVRYKENYSFARMNNKAIEYALRNAKTDWIMFINDDAFVDKHYFLKLSLMLNKNKNMEIISPLIYENGTKLIDSFGVEYFNSGYAKNNNRISLKTQLASAACLLTKTSLLLDLKKKYGFYFNEILISYMEDVDFTLRMRMLNKNIYKSKDLIVHHVVSFSNQRKSRYVIYQTYRNIIWLLIMNWPLRNIINNLHNIVLVQLWAFFYSTITRGPFLYISLWIDTIRNLKKLLEIRRSTVGSYNSKFDFRNILSKYAFRTYHGYKVKLP